jgi:hypothetical protein
MCTLPWKSPQLSYFSTCLWKKNVGLNANFSRRYSERSMAMS